MVTHTKPAENNASEDAESRFEKAFERLEVVCEKLNKRNHMLESAQKRASDELHLHIRNLGRILERQE